MLRDVWTVFITEFIDHSRDRRSLFAAFSYAIFGPILLIAGLNMGVQQIRKTDEITLAVIGAEHAPVLVGELERRGIVVERRAAGPEPIPTLDGADAVLVVPADHAARWMGGRSSDLMLYLDERRQSSMRAAQRVGRHLRDYGGEVAQSRLLARGVPTEAVQPLRVVQANVAVAQAGTVMIANLLVYFFIMAAFFTSMSMAIDATAGERERRSLRPLLAQPVSAGSLILGKWANAALFGLLGTALTVILGTTMLRFAPLEELRISMQITPMTQLLMILVLLPLSLAVAACQILLGLAAKSFKEAQIYIQLFSMMPLVLVSFASFSGRDPEGLMKVAPVLGQADVLKTLMSDATLGLSQAAGVGGLTLAILLAALAGARAMLLHERILKAA